MVDLRDYTRRKLNLLDRANVDLRLTDQDYRVLSYVAAAIDQETELARRKQQVIATALGKKGVRGVQISLGRLAVCGYLKFETKEGGTYVNAYRLMLEKASTDASSYANKANQHSSSNTNKAHPYSPSINRRRTGHSNKANGHPHEGEAPFVHEPFISLEIPTAREPAIVKALGSLAVTLADRIGADHAYSWFGKAAVVDVLGETITIQFPSKFIRDRARSDYGQAVLECCKALAPSIKRIAFIVAAESAA